MLELDAINEINKIIHFKNTREKTNIDIKQNPHKCGGFAFVVTETNKPVTS